MKPALPTDLSEPVRRHLECHSRSFLLTLRADGSPTAHPMTALLEEGALVFNTYRKSAKARNVERDRRLAVVLLDGYDAAAGEGRRGFALEGEGEVCRVEGHTEQRGSGPEVAAAQRERVGERLREGKRIFIRTRCTSGRAIESAVPSSTSSEST